MGTAAKIALLLACLTLPLVVVAVRTAWSEIELLRPPRVTSQQPAPSSEFVGLREVSFQSSDNLALKGWYIPSRNRAAILLVHGYGANRSELLPEARLLARRGYGVLLFDSRAHGESEGEIVTYGAQEQQDVRGAIAFLSAQPDVDSHRIGALGFSAGASAVLLEAAQNTQLQAIALEAPATSLSEFCEDEFGRLAWLKTWPTLWAISASGVNVAALDMHARINRLAPRPLLILHGDEDPVVPLRRAQQMFAAAAEPKQLLLVRGAKHGGYTEVDAAGVEQALGNLFDAALVQR